MSKEKLLIIPQNWLGDIVMSQALLKRIKFDNPDTLIDILIDSCMKGVVTRMPEINKTIILKERDVNESQLDFYFLTSPAEIEKKIIMLGQINYSPIKNSKIFISFSSFNSMENKISTINNLNEKKN